MPRSKSKKNQKKTRRRTQGQGARQVAQLVAKQNRALLALAGIGASGFSDISKEHDTYLHEKP